MPTVISGAESRKRWFGPMVTMADALWMIDETGRAFLVLSAIQAVLAFFVGLLMLIDAAAFCVLAYFLMRFKSRVAACMLLGLGLLEGTQTLVNRFGGQKAGGTHVILAVIVAWVGVRAVQATFKYWNLRRHAVVGQQS